MKIPKDRILIELKTGPAEPWHPVQVTALANLLACPVAEKRSTDHFYYYNGVKYPGITRVIRARHDHADFYTEPARALGSAIHNNWLVNDSLEEILYNMELVEGITDENKGTAEIGNKEAAEIMLKAIYAAFEELGIDKNLPENKSEDFRVNPDAGYGGAYDLLAPGKKEYCGKAFLLYVSPKQKHQNGKGYTLEEIPITDMPGNQGEFEECLAIFKEKNGSTSKPVHLDVRVGLTKKEIQDRVKTYFSRNLTVLPPLIKQCETLIEADKQHVLAKKRLNEYKAIHVEPKDFLKDLKKSFDGLYKDHIKPFNNAVQEAADIFIELKEKDDAARKQRETEELQAAVKKYEEEKAQLLEQAERFEAENTPISLQMAKSLKEKANRLTVIHKTKEIEKTVSKFIKPGLGKLTIFNYTTFIAALIREFEKQPDKLEEALKNIFCGYKVTPIHEIVNDKGNEFTAIEENGLRYERVSYLK